MHLECGEFFVLLFACGDV